MRINSYGPYAVHSIELIGELLLFLLGSENIYFKMFILIFKQMDLQWFGTDDRYASITIDRFHQFSFQIDDVNSIFIHASNRMNVDCPPDAHYEGLRDN